MSLNSNNFLNFIVIVSCVNGPVLTNSTFLAFQWCAIQFRTLWMKFSNMSNFQSSVLSIQFIFASQYRAPFKCTLLERLIYSFVLLLPFYFTKIKLLFPNLVSYHTVCCLNQQLPSPVRDQTSVTGVLH